MANLDTNDILSQYLAGQAAQKNPTGIFGLRQTPYLTDADKAALRFQNLQDAFKQQGSITGMLASQAGDQLGQGLAKMFGGGPDNTRPPDPQLEALPVYQQALQQTKDPMMASFAAYQYLAQRGVPGAMEKAQEAYKALQEQANKDREYQLNKDKDTYTDAGTNPRGQQLQKNGLGKLEAVGSGPLVTVNAGQKLEDKAQQKSDEEYITGFYANKKAIDTAATQALATKSQAAAIAKLADETPMTGPLSKAALPLFRTLEQIGAVPKGTTADYDSLKNVSMNAIISLAQLIKPVSNSDMNILQESGPGILQTQAGNKAMAVMMSVGTQYALDVKKYTDEFLKKSDRNPTKKVDGMTYEEFMQSKLDNKQYMTDEQRALFHSQTTIPTVASKADYDKLQSGDYYVDSRTGKTMVKR